MLREECAKQRLGARRRPRISTSPTPADCGSADSSGCSVMESPPALRIVPYGNRGGGIFIGVVARIRLPHAATSRLRRKPTICSYRWEHIIHRLMREAWDSLFLWMHWPGL